MFEMISGVYAHIIKIFTFSHDVEGLETSKQTAWGIAIMAAITNVPHVIHSFYVLDFSNSKITPLATFIVFGVVFIIAMLPPFLGFVLFKKSIKTINAFVLSLMGMYTLTYITYIVPHNIVGTTNLIITFYSLIVYFAMLAKINKKKSD